MRFQAKVGILFAVIAPIAWLISHEVLLRRQSQKLESRRTELVDELVRLQTNLNEERLHWYYAFRQVEEPDGRAWDLAVRKVDGEIAASSNELARVESQLASMRPAGGR